MRGCMAVNDIIMRSINFEITPISKTNAAYILT